MLSNRKHFSILTAAALAAVLSACGGGGGGSIPSTTNTGSSSGQPTSSQGNANASMVVTIPAKTSTSNHRNPKYISASTQSMTVSLVASGKTTLLTTANLTPTSPGCSVGAGGSTQCTVSFITTAGSDTFLMNMYDGANGKGNLLSTGQSPIETITAGKANTIDVALDGVPASLSVVLGQGTLPVGTASSTSLTVVAEDADNNVIIGPGGFSSAISLAISGDTYNTLAVSYGAGQSSITSPGQTVTLNYTGGSNVGSTITASTTGATSGSATFGGSGGAITSSSYYDSANYIYLYPYDVAAFSSTSNPQAAVLSELYMNSTSTYGIGLASPSGVQKIFYGSGTDPFSPVSSPSAIAGVTVVPGMSTELEDEEFEAYDAIAVNNTNSGVYYPTYFSNVSDATNCSGGTESSGAIGELNTSSGKLVFPEIPLKGYAGAIKLDSSGNLWWIEWTGTCSTTGNLLGSDTWAIGELPAGSTTPIETPFSTAGITWSRGNNDYPSDMSISADGSKMYILNDNSPTNNAQSVVEVTTASMASTSVEVTASYYGYAIATAPDGTTLWSSDEDPVDNYYYGWIPGSKSFASSNVSEAAFPISYQYFYGLTFGDNSFWAAGSEDEPVGGFGRFSGLSAGTPQVSWYPAIGAYPEINSVSIGGGYVWGTDYDYYTLQALQYGVQSTATQTINKSRRLGPQAAFPKPVRNDHHVAPRQK